MFFDFEIILIWWPIGYLQFYRQILRFYCQIYQFYRQSSQFLVLTGFAKPINVLIALIKLKLPRLTSCLYLLFTFFDSENNVNQ